MNNKSVKILMMRHGASDFNVISEFYSNYNHGGPIFYRISKTNSFRDSELSALGKLQVNEMSKYIRKLPVKYMFVSPLRRCLESSYYLYKDLPDHIKPNEILVIPELRELILSMNDIPFYWKTAIDLDIYADYDFSNIKKYMNDDTWFYKNCNAYKDFHQLENICNDFFNFNHPNRDKNFIDSSFFSTMIKEENPHSLEPHGEILKRVDSCKSIIKDFIKKKQEEGIEVMDNEILVVSHYNLLSYFVGLRKFKKVSYNATLNPASAFTYDFDVN